MYMYRGLWFMAWGFWWFQVSGPLLLGTVGLRRHSSQDVEGKMIGLLRV